MTGVQPQRWRADFQPRSPETIVFISISHFLLLQVYHGEQVTVVDAQFMTSVLMAKLNSAEASEQPRVKLNLNGCERN